MSPPPESCRNPPRHVAIIMDGNGRWAKQRGWPRTIGHKAGLEAVRRTVRAAPELGVEFLTLYAFSSENWSRPPAEVRDLMGLLKHFIARDLADLHKAGVRIRIVGRRDDLSADILNLLIDAEELTRNNTKHCLQIAFNYGARDEIVRAAQSLARDAAAGRLDPDAITAELFALRLDTRDIPDPELIIRTSGELRLSNFLLWQAAYSEFVFLPCYWPDFDRNQFEAAIAEYLGRDRRFGGVVAQELAV